ncbi:MAG: flagellar hook-associated protein FlgL [Synergistaceae bacterium]|nr:flagellar hook-associated protein FlgL [Synergistaceae bacterium]
MPRVTNSMVQNLMLSDMHNNLSRLLDYQQQLASGKKHARPSDHPIDVTRELALQTTLLENKQYIRNQDDAMTWLSNTDAAFNQMTDIAHRIRELTIYAGNGALGPGETQAIAAEINELQEELRNIANYSVEGRFLLSGLSTGVRPFGRDAQGNVVYNGNTGKVQYEVEKSVVGNVSFHGREVFQEQFSSNTLTSVELPMDFVWSGRDEIIQIAVGERTVKVRLSEDWTDSDRSNIVELTDFNRFRDYGEVEGLTLDQIAEQINTSTEMGDVSRLLAVSVQKDSASGTQRLVFRSHTGEPIQVTGWPETDLVDQPQAILGEDASGWISGEGSITVFIGNKDEVDVAIDPSDTLSSVAEKLSLVAGLSARLSPEGDRLLATAENPGVSFRLELSGSARGLFPTPSGHTAVSEPSKRAVDHSHIDFASLLGLETTLKSVQFNSDIALDNGDLHLRFESGANFAELKIEAGKTLTVEQFAERIRQVAGDWLEVVVQEDETEKGHDTSLSLEEATRRLIIRPKENKPLVVFDKNSSGYALNLGFSTALQSNAGSAVVFPNIPCVDDNMAAQLKVTVGGKDFAVKLYPDDVAPAGTVNRTEVMKQIVKQVNTAAGRTVLGYTVLDAATGRSALYSNNGESLRVVDLPIADPSFNPSYTAGIALQMGIASGLTGGSVAGDITPGPGTLRVESLGRTVDIDISAGDTPKMIADRIRNASGGWLDVNFFDADLPDGTSDVRLQIAAKDGSPVSVFDVEGNVARAMRIDNAVRIAPPPGWSPAAGETLSITVDGYTHTIDLGVIVDSDQSGALDIGDVAAAINARFQGQDIKATLLENGAMALTSPRGYAFTVASEAPVPDAPTDSISTRPLLSETDPSEVSLVINAADTLTLTFDGAITEDFPMNFYDIDIDGRLDLPELQAMAAAIQAHASFFPDITVSVSPQGVLSVQSAGGEPVALATTNIQLKEAMSPYSILESTSEQAETQPLFASAPLDVSAGPPVDTLRIRLDGYAPVDIDLNALDANFSGTLTIEELEDLPQAILDAFDLAYPGMGLVTASISGEGVLTVRSTNGAALRMSATSADFDEAMSPQTLSSATPRRDDNGSGRYTQNVVVRTASDSRRTDFFGVIEKLADAVSAEDREGLSNVMLGQIDDFIDNLLRCRTSGGAILNRYENNQARFKQNNVYVTELYSKVSDVDLAETSTKFLMAQAVYQSSLAVIAKIVQPTLVDFLR